MGTTHGYQSRFNLLMAGAQTIGVGRVATGEPLCLAGAKVTVEDRSINPPGACAMP